MIHGRKQRTHDNREEDASRLGTCRDRLKRKFASSRLVSSLDVTHIYLWTIRREDLLLHDVIRRQPLNENYNNEYAANY